MRILKNIAVRALALFLFFVMIAAVILYQLGAYDISFIKRPARGEQTDTTGENLTNPPIITTPNTFIDITETMPPMGDEEIQEILNSIKLITELKDYAVSYKKYSDSTVLARVDHRSITDGKFSLRNTIINKTVFYTLDNGRIKTTLKNFQGTAKAMVRGNL